MSFVRGKRGSVRELLEMLTYARPYKSATEQEFVNRFVVPLAPTSDAFGNHYCWIEEAPIIWSCHTDTVHAVPGRQNIIREANLVSLKYKKAGKCLGADDAAGVWMLSEMIKAKIPGLYIFHRGEEKGGLGSKYIAQTLGKILEPFKFAIAFDRKGKDSIITHQMGKRCCSEAFVKDFSKRMGLSLGYYADNTGMFTDTASYMDIISECTNISVGYEREHGPTEMLDIYHLQRLRDAMVTINLKGLECHRDPTVREWKSWRPTNQKDEEEIPTLETIQDFVEEYPHLAAILLEEAGYTPEDFAAFITTEPPTI
jgi:hypothetical protein